MAACLDLVTSPAATVALAAALLWPALTGFPTWPALSSGRLGSTLTGSVAVGCCVFAFVQRLTAQASA